MVVLLQVVLVAAASSDQQIMNNASGMKTRQWVNLQALPTHAVSGNDPPGALTWQQPSGEGMDRYGITNVRSDFLLCRPITLRIPSGHSRIEHALQWIFSTPKRKAVHCVISPFKIVEDHGNITSRKM